MTLPPPTNTSVDGEGRQLGSYRARWSLAVVPVQIEKLRIFRTIFWVSVRDNLDIAGSTELVAMQAVYQSSEVGFSIPYILNSRGNCHSSLAALVRTPLATAAFRHMHAGAGLCK